MRGKRLAAIALALLMLVPLLACGGKTTYRVEGDRDAFIGLKARYAEGDKVKLKTYIVYDASPTVTADGEILSPRVEGNAYLVYTFIMPAHDVTVTYSLGGSDMMMQPFRITYESLGKRVVDPVMSAYPGETVTVKLEIIFDETTDVFFNGEKAQQVSGPGDYLYFAFTMPYEDVEVTAESVNISGVDSE